MCKQQRLRPACAYAQSDLSLCYSLRYYVSIKLLTEQHLELLSLKWGRRGFARIPLSVPRFQISYETKLFHFHGILRKMREISKANPHTFIHINPLSRNPGHWLKSDILTPSFSTLDLIPDQFQHFKMFHKWAASWDFQQCGMCNQQRLIRAVWSEPMLAAWILYEY